MTKINFKLGDSVVVNPNVIDPDFNRNIGSWQGRISEINSEDNVVCISWDSLTLQHLICDLIDQCEQENLDWSKMYLNPEEVKLTTPRDSEEEVRKIIDLLEKEHKWSYLGEEGRRIQAVLANDDEDAFEAWEEHFKNVLKFPFDAKVSEPQERGSLRDGDTVTIVGLEGSNDLYGILASLRHKGQKSVFPLCDLEVIDKGSSNYQPVKDYVVWFANC